jgi:phage replication-related protein YjqB (UPF0714/DUF867 family)
MADENRQRTAVSRWVPGNFPRAETCTKSEKQGIRLPQPDQRKHSKVLGLQSSQSLAKIFGNEVMQNTIREIGLTICSITASLLLGSNPIAAASDNKDRFANYSELSAHEREGVDYRVEVIDRASPVTVFAIHGGKIEASSDNAAKLVAGDDWNVYAFVATKAANNRDLHLTSTHFDEPRALSLAKRSDRCVSMHGFALSSNTSVACVGGGSAPLSKAVYQALKARVPEITVEYPCTRFGGSDPANILNRCIHPGVQIEMSPALREMLSSDPQLAAKFKDAVRSGMTPGR